MKTITTNSTAIRAVLLRGRPPCKANTDKSDAANGIISQVGAKPPNMRCHKTFIGAWHTQCGISAITTIGPVAGRQIGLDEVGWR